MTISDKSRNSVQFVLGLTCLETKSPSAILNKFLNVNKESPSNTNMVLNVNKESLSNTYEFLNVKKGPSAILTSSLM